METNVNKTVKTATGNINQAADDLAKKFKETHKDINASASDASSFLSDSYDDALNLVKEYPLYSFLGAAAVGLLAGAMIKGIGRD